MSSWEHQIVRVPALDLATAGTGSRSGAEALDRASAVGWEAVVITTLEGAGIAVLMKRPVADGHEARRGRPSRAPTDRPNG